MAVVKVENKTYTVDPLYQWDKNQVLEIRGLSLAKVPEIHFTNTLMAKSVVRPANMDAAGIITAQVPNSLLQKASRITVYVCTYEGSTFKTLYKIEIPVRSRPMPADYTFEDDAGEIYSFNALETQVANALTAADEAKNSYNAAAQKETTAAQDLAACKALLEQATALYASAEQKYSNALDTLNGVEDGSVFLKKAGDEMAGAINMNGNAITDLADPESDTDAANKGYVDATGVKLTTLWENENTTLDEKTASIDLTNHSLIHIMWLVENSNRPKYFDSIHAVGMGETLTVERYLYGRHLTRNFTVTNTGVAFEIAKETTGDWDETGAWEYNESDSASVIIPVRISGVTLGRDNE